MTSAHEDDESIEAANHAVVVPFRKDPPTVSTAPAVDMQKKPGTAVVSSNRARDLAKRVAKPLPDRARVVESTKWWATVSARTLPWVPVLLIKELKPVGQGVGMVITAWSAWVAASGRHEYAKDAEGNKKATLGTAADKAQTARRWLTGVVLVLAVGAGVWGYYTHFWYLVAALILIAAFLDLLARRARPKVEFAPAMPSILTSSVPLNQITKSIIACLEREGHPEGTIGVAEPMQIDMVRQQYEISIATVNELTPDHVRAIERAIGAKDHAIRNLRTETASVRRLIISIGDPLAGAQESEWIPNGSLSFRDPLPLGRSGGVLPMAVRFLGAHCGIVGKTRSGKTEGLLWTIIDRFAACKDLVIWGIDLQAGPAFPLWRGIIQRVAYTPEDAYELLLAAIEEMDRRKVILREFAESDDPEHEATGTVWTAEMGHYVEIIIDEFALTAAFNGKNDTINLMGLLEIIIRTGLKFGFHLTLATQKTGNSDFGSSLMQTQLSIKILLACEERDTVTMLSTDDRDAGWSPHLLRPAQDQDPGDAGTCYIKGPAHTVPDKYKSDYWPAGAIKPRARRRMAEGLPSLDDDQMQEGTVDAVEIPEILAAVESAFAAAGNPDFLATKGLLALLEDDGVVLAENELGAEMNEAFTAAGVERNDQRKRVPGEKNAVRGYWLANIRAAIGGFS